MWCTCNLYTHLHLSWFSPANGLSHFFFSSTWDQVAALFVGPSTWQVRPCALEVGLLVITVRSDWFRSRRFVTTVRLDWIGRRHSGHNGTRSGGGRFEIRSGTFWWKVFFLISLCWKVSAFSLVLYTNMYMWGFQVILPEKKTRTMWEHGKIDNHVSPTYVAGRRNAMPQPIPCAAPVIITTPLETFRLTSLGTCVRRRETQSARLV